MLLLIAAFAAVVVALGTVARPDLQPSLPSRSLMDYCFPSRPGQEGLELVGGPMMSLVVASARSQMLVLLNMSRSFPPPICYHHMYPSATLSHTI